MAWDGNPEQLVRDEYLWALHREPARAKPGLTLTLDHPPAHQCEMVNDRICFTGAVLKDDGLIYRIGEYHEEMNCWHARWPD